MWHSQASRDWECWAAIDMPAPAIVWMVRGSVAAPPNMYFILAAWLTSWSMAMPRKSMNMMSMIGRVPVAAAPTPRPTRAASEIGVSKTRSTPKRACRPRVMPKTEP